MDKEIKSEFDNLAVMVNRGFEGVDKRFEQVNQRFEQVDRRFEAVDKRFDQVDKKFAQVDKRFDQVAGELGHMNARLSTIEHDVAQIGKEMISRSEFEDLMGRVKYLELKLNIESGK